MTDRIADLHRQNVENSEPILDPNSLLRSNKKSQELKHEEYRNQDKSSEPQDNLEKIDLNLFPVFFEEDVIKLEKLGEGGFGEVFKGYHKRLNEFVALKNIKCLPKPTSEQVKRFQEETELLNDIEEIRKKQKNLGFLK